MTAKRPALRAAAIAAINAFFDTLDEAEAATPKRAPSRPAYVPPGDNVSDTDQAAAVRALRDLTR